MGETRSRCRETDLGEIEGGLREGQSIGVDDSSERWRVKGNKAVRTLSAKRVQFFSFLFFSHSLPLHVENTIHRQDRFHHFCSTIQTQGRLNQNNT